MDEEKKEHTEERFEVAIERLSFGGEGVARHQGKVVFIPRAAPGDVLQVKITRERPRFNFASIEKIVKPSTLRTRPPCPFFASCGGCHLQHLNYPEQLKAKRAALVEALERIGKLSEPPVEEAIPARLEFHYRNKAYFHFSWEDDGLCLGLKSLDGERVTDLTSCMIADQRIDKLYQLLRKELAVLLTGSQALPFSAICFRVSEASGKCVLILVTTPDNQRKTIELIKKSPIDDFDVMLNIKHPASKEMFGNQWQALQGDGKLEEELLGLRFILGPGSFFQVNSKMTERLVQTALKLLDAKGNQKVVDLYCGCGTFSLPLSKQVKELTGIELSREATMEAIHASKINAIKNVKFYTGKAERMFQKQIRQGYDAELLLADPPRSGLDKGLVPLIDKSAVKRFVYISCSPPTLARDAKQLIDCGFDLQTVIPLDLFPQTYHIEAAALFVRN